MLYGIRAQMKQAALTIWRNAAIQYLGNKQVNVIWFGLNCCLWNTRIRWTLANEISRDLPIIVGTFTATKIFDTLFFLICVLSKSYFIYVCNGVLHGLYQAIYYLFRSKMKVFMHISFKQCSCIFQEPPLINIKWDFFLFSDIVDLLRH